MGVILASVVATACHFWAQRHKSRAAVSQCVQNLYAIRNCKDFWMDDEHKATNDTPTWDDLKECFERHGFAGGKPVCPKGGTYIPGQVSENPKCSVGGNGHTLPPHN